MTDVLNSILEANSSYSKGFDKGHLKANPVKNFAILTCIDSRFDPAKCCGLKEGDAHIIRNAGGRATDDAIRSLVISHKLLGTTEWIVIHHTDCGMQTITDKEIAKLLEEDLETAVFDGKKWSNIDREKSDNNKKGSQKGHEVEWHTFSNLKDSITEDIKKIRNHALIPSHIKVHGFVYDVKTGKLTNSET